MMLLGSDYLPNIPYIRQEEVGHNQVQAQKSTPINVLRPVGLAPVPAPKPLPPLPSRRREMMKFVTYALIILFALAVYTTIEMVIKETVAGSDLGYKQELGIRVLYVLFIFLGLWNIKFFMQ